MTSFFRRFKFKLSNPFRKPSPGGGANEIQPPAPAKIKLRTRAYTYLNNIYTDYKEVAKDTVKSINKRPFRALTYGLATTAVLVFYKKNPSRRDYDSRRVELGNEMIMCGTVRSRRADYYLGEVNKLANLGLLEYRSFVLFSLVLIRKRGTEFGDCNYESRCAPLNQPNKFNVFNAPNMLLREMARIVDIGFCGEWHFLNKNFRDYDVDEMEWINKGSK